MTNNPFTTGDWIQWSTPDHVKQGEVVVSSGPSIKVAWLGGGEAVFPVVEGYIAGPYRSDHWRIDIIPRPKGASRIKREQLNGRMSVARAAALLGIEQKRIRAMLRSGALRGEQTDGKWSAVNAEDVMSKVDYA
jgi:hypothetical protein